MLNDLEWFCLSKELGKRKLGILRKDVGDSQSLQPNNKKPSAAVIYNPIQLRKVQSFVVKC